MRHALVVGLTLVVSASAVGADKPIPQDAARKEKRYRDRLEWNRKTLQGGYDKVGKKDPRWDKPAREALELAAKMFTPQFDPFIDPADVHVLTRKAIDAGCTDPFILYLNARTSVGTNFPGMPQYNKQLRDAAVAMSASQYSPYRRAVAEEAAIRPEASKANLPEKERRELEKRLDGIIDLLARSVAEDPRNQDWESGWFDKINAVIAWHRQLGGDYKAAFDRVDARLAKIKGIEALRLTVKGFFLVTWAWEARTNQVARQVTEEQFRTFAQRCMDARVTLLKAWKLNPDEPNVARTMMMVEKGIGQGDREAMETWFERAMMVDGDDREACWQKLDWLDPKWYGGESSDAMIAFGRACAETRNWHNGISLLIADAHFRHWAMLPQENRLNYMRSQEVWPEIRSVYEVYFKHYPDDDVQRSKFAMIC
jgi:hypothetical protein